MANSHRTTLRQGGIPRWAWIVAVVLATAAVVGLVLGSTGKGSTQPDTEGPAAPGFALPGFDGETIRLTDFQGTPLVVNFWASWCVPCLAELPGFEQVYQRHKAEVAFLGINLTDGLESAQAVREYTGITYPVARDVDGSAFAAFGGFGMPTTVFISPDGRIVETYTGELSAEALEERIARYFGTG